MNRRVETTALMEAVYHEVQRAMPSRKWKFGEAIQWVLEDINWREPGVPAYGRWSPVCLGILAAATESLRGDKVPPPGASPAERERPPGGYEENHSALSAPVGGEDNT